MAILRAMSLFIFCLSACSLDLDWDVGRLGCDPNGACLAGYSCLDAHCVADHSRAVNQACNQQAQCGGGEACLVSFLDRPCDGDAACRICASGCDLHTAYSESTCGQGAFCTSYCTAELSAYAPPPPSFVACQSDDRAGACVQSDGCAVNQACTLVNQSVAGNGNAVGVCVSISDNATACLQACSFDFNRTTNKDNCGSTTANNYTCQPVGQTGKQQLVCIPPIVGQELPTGSTGCDAGQNICTPGNACVGGVCRMLCNTAASSCGTLTCTALSGLATPPPGINTGGVGYCH